MIKVDRTRVPIPNVLRRGTGSLADREFEAARRFYEEYDHNRQRGGFQFTAFRHASVRTALNQLFNNKCAYCESRISHTGVGDIEQFRPKAGVLTGASEFLPLHYWWLSNEWSNLYIACIDCNRISSRRSGAGIGQSGKGGRFPLQDETTRAPVLAGPDLLALEMPLLLDPCVDHVGQILIFSEDGKVTSRDHRGLTSIEIIGLNRPNLVEERRRTASIFKAIFEVLIENNRIGRYRADLRAQVDEMISPAAPYAGMCRQLLLDITEALPSTEGESLLALYNHISWSEIAAPQQEEGRLALAQFQAMQESYSLEDKGPDSTAAYLRARDRRVERLSIRNLRAISKLNLDAVDRGGRAPWLMLLGENAAGKSTILHSLALALIGDRYRSQLVSDLGIDLSRLVRIGAAFGEIRVWLSGATEPRVLRIYANGQVETEGRDAQLMVLGYGSTRLLPRRELAERTDAQYARIENLFDPFIPLADAERWLLEIDQQAFDYAAIAIKKSLSIGLERKLVREDGKVGLIERGGLTPLSMLCDGYQTVIALIVDILAVVLPTWRTPDLAQGLVLIDEVGNHLHPSWKLRFVESIREIFPSVQVVATTHEPLCLRGLQEGEIAVLHKGPRGRITLMADLPSIEGMRVDQILTSEHFGLSSTLDPEMQERFDRYYVLLRKNAPNDTETSEMLELRADINRIQQLGNTERERRMLDAIDRFLSHRSIAGDPLQLANNEATLDADLAAIWREADGRGEPTS